MAKQPSFQFYPGDWLKDPALQSCSAAAIGAFINLLCYAFECEPRGYLITNGVPWTIQRMANMGKVKSKMVRQLVDVGVFKLDAHLGAYFSKRMVEDERLRAVRAAAGQRGGKQTRSKPGENHKQTTEQKAPPSSSSSSSASATPPHTPPEGGVAREILAALVLEFHSEGITGAEERSLRRVLPDFEKLCGQTPGLIAKRAKEWRVRGNHKLLTPQLLRRHWSALRTDDLLDAWSPTKEEIDALD